jgi:hypothetical protein
VLPSQRTAGTFSPAALVLALLLAADGVFIGVHLINEVHPSVNNRLYALDVDRSYSEVFQYIKFFWVGLLLAAVGWLVRAAVYGGWALLFVYLICDDALQVHERVGAWAVTMFPIPSALGLRAQDFGELAVSASAGLVLLAVIASLYPLSNTHAKNASKDLTLLMIVLVFFGVVFDLLHIAMDGPVAGVLFGVMEDGGEMIAASLMVAYGVRLYLAEGRVPVTLLRAARQEASEPASLRPSDA